MLGKLDDWGGGAGGGGGKEKPCGLMMSAQLLRSDLDIRVTDGSPYSNCH